MTHNKPLPTDSTPEKTPAHEATDSGENKQQSREIGGPQGRPEPTRYGDWEKNGRCIDF